MKQHLATLAVHAGEDKRKPYGALTTPIVQTSTYTFENTAEIMDFMHRKAAGTAERDEYGRYSNPTQRVAERKLAALEGGERALLFASGMAAITTTMLAYLSSGDHVILLNDTYRRTREFAASFLGRWGIETTLISPDSPGAWAAALRPNTRMLFCETPTNPYLRVVDLAEMVAAAQQQGALTMVDSTFATPVNMQPLALGVDFVVHSATKYLGGHNDLLAGVVVGTREALDAVAQTRGVFGGMSNPNDAYLLLRGLKTLELRVLRQNESGQRVAEFLAANPAIERVHYPGLPQHPDHAVAQRQMSGFGGVVSFEVAGDMARTGLFVDRLQLPYIGPTLGGVESIVQQPAALFSLNPEDRRAAGLKDNLVRYALGIESADDLVADLQQALAGI